MASKKKSANKKKTTKKKVIKKKVVRKKATTPHNPKKKLKSAKYEHFCNVYIIHYNASDAWRTANGRDKQTKLPGDGESGSRLLKKAEIRLRIEHLEYLRTERTKLDQDKILNLLSSMATADITDAYDEDGTLLPLSKIPKNVRMLIEGIDSSEIKERDPSGNMEVVGQLKKLKVSGRHKTIELAGKHVAIQAFKDRVDVSGKVTLADLVAGVDKDSE